MLFEIAAMKVSALTQSSFSIVTDEEKGIVNAIRKYLPNFNPTSLLESYF